ncbi:molybdopterin-binding protein [Olsenella uli]|uniref:molybdopterin-binding protein n=1 Tax=Olsenella uli TaxID=133926 RepID=UPI0012AC5AA0|nr:molybdopterin-binding protein [Olsenella uli]
MAEEKAQAADRVRGGRPRDGEGEDAHTVAIVTVSDRSAAGERADAAGPALRDLLEGEGYEVASATVVPDDRPRIEAAITEAAASDVALCVTTGGTGLGPRDVTPEATAAVCDRLVPGIGEAMRTASAQITPYAWLSRATAGTLGRTLVVNVPGSPRAAVENLSAVLKPVAHGIRTLRAEGPLDCASERVDAPADEVVMVPPLSERPCVLFDFDGTLADTKPAIVDTARRVLREWGMTDDEIADPGRLVGPPFPAGFSLVYGMSDEDAAEVTRRYRAIYSKLGLETYMLFDGMAELLQSLKAAGRRLAITTSKREETAHTMLADNGVEQLFDVIVGQTDPTRADKTTLLGDTLAALGCSADEAVMVGDRFYDVEGAAANGVPCVGVYLGGTAPKGELEAAGAAACVHSVEGLGKVLLG